MSQKNAVLVALAAVALISGVANQYFYPGRPFPPTTLWFLAAGALLIFAWYCFDARQIGYHRSPWLDVAVVAVAFVALPYYFFRSRGARKGLVATILFVLAGIAYSALTILGQYAAHVALQS